MSNDYLWRFLSRNDIDRLAHRGNYGRVGCFKGFDDHSFSFNTGAAPELFSAQFRLMSKIVRAGFDVYGYVTLTSDDGHGIAQKMSDFVDRLQSEVHELFPLRVVPLQIHRFTPTAGRMDDRHEKALSIQVEAVEAWVKEIERRYPPDIRARPIFETRVE